MLHQLRKLRSTLSILLQLGLARTFGEYQHSVYDDGVQYARYKWRGKEWAIPTSPIEKEL